MWTGTWYLATAALISTTGGLGHLDRVEHRVDRHTVTVSAGVYGLGPTHEITGSLVGGSHYFNSDGIYTADGQVSCPGYRYMVKPRQGTSRINVRIPRSCIGTDAGKAVRVRLIMRDEQETERATYIELDRREVQACTVKPRRSCR